MNPVIDNSTAQAQASQTDVNDDLAKALASVQAGPAASMDFEEVGEPALTGVPAAPAASSDDKTTPAPTVAEPEYATPEPAPAAPKVDDAAPSASGGDMIEQIKISALQELRPLMQHIDLSPEERFEKYLMMLRASDDPSLIQPTYEAAQKISGEKLRAQALLDVINEINYLNSQQLVA
jgi:hypothetical protein